MSRPVIAICIGHSRIGDSGAVNTNGVSEHQFNSEIGQLVAGILEAKGYSPFVIDDYPRSSYGSAMRWLADEIKRLKASLAVELHFNSATPFANGHEWLFWHRSMRGQKLASLFNDSFRAEFPEQRARGIKPIDSRVDRGGLFLFYTHCPASILEPYFGSNKQETDFYTANKERVAKAYAEAIIRYFQ